MSSIICTKSNTSSALKDSPVSKTVLSCIFFRPFERWKIDLGSSIICAYFIWKFFIQQGRRELVKTVSKYMFYAFRNKKKHKKKISHLPMHFTSKVNYKQTKTLFTRILFTCVSQWLESTVKQSSINMVEGWHTSWKKNNIFLMFSLQHQFTQKVW